jgi:hypothetical protein
MGNPDGGDGTSPDAGSVQAEERPRRTFEEPRPTSVTVIGWVWLILGGYMCVGSALVLLMWLMGQTQADGERTVFLLERLEPLIICTQLVFGAAGFFAGLKFLDLKSWARTVLEVLTWILLVYTVGFGCFWVYTWISQHLSRRLSGRAIVFGAAGILVTCVFAVPLAIMLRYLRSQRIRGVLRSEDE